MDDFDVLIQSFDGLETSFPHFETSAQKVKPPHSKSETSRFHRDSRKADFSF